MKKPKAFVLYPNQWEPLSCLTDEQLGRLFRHIFCWLNDGSLDMKKEEQLVEPDILLAFRFMRMQINIDIDKYQQLCEKRKEAANKRWSKNANDANAYFAMHNNNNKNNNKNKNNSNNRRRDSSSSSVISEKDANDEEEDEEENSLVFEKAEKQWLPWFNETLDDNCSASLKV